MSTERDEQNPLDDLTPKQEQALAQLAEQRADASTGRRDLLKALGIGALGIGAGSAATEGLTEAVGTASAQSTSDSVGDVGTPSDPVDVFAEGIDSTSVSTDSLSVTQYRDEADYLIYDRGGTIYAWKAGTETEEFSGSDPGAVFNSAYGDLTRGKVVLVGRLTGIDTPLRIDNSQVAVEGAGRGTNLVAGANIGSGDYLVDIGAASGNSMLQAPRVQNLVVFTGGNSFAGAYRISNATGGLFQGLAAGGGGIVGIRMDDSRGPTSNNTVYPPQLLNVENGVEIRQAGADYVNRNTFLGGVVEGRGTTGSVGLKVGGTGETANTNKFIGVDVENFPGNDAEIAGEGNRIIACNLEGGGGLTVTADASKTRIVETGHASGLTDNGTATMVGNVGEESANAETPTAANWKIGDIVDFTDTGDGSGTGTYILLPDNSTWRQLA